MNNLRIGYLFKPAFMKELGVYLTINNLFNESYATDAFVYSYIEGGRRRKDDGYRTQAGVHAMARITMRF